MAHTASKRAAVRRDYIQKRQTIAQLVIKHSVTHATISRWKKQDEENGDSWDRCREAARMADGGLADITSKVLSDFSALYTETMERLKGGAENPVATAKAIASLSKSYQQTVKAAGCVDPALAKLGIAMEVLERLGDYIRDQRPDLLADFSDILEPFGQELSAELAV